jgi:phosphatidylglycerophosphate synthase
LKTQSNGNKEEALKSDQQIAVLVPALIPLGFFAGGLVLYSVLCLVGRRPALTEKRERGNFFDFFIHYFVWVIGPIERFVVALRLTPNQVTLTALICCAAAAVSIGTGHMATAGWLYVCAGMLDVLDGRVARATNRASKAGAFLDSVTDRWGELLVFTGFAWFLRDSYWLLAVMLAATGSVMVSYARARAEGLGIDLTDGIMQRSERMTIVSIGTLITAWFNAAPDTRHYGVHVMGVALLLCGVGATGTAISRFVQGYRRLAALEQPHSEDAEVEKTPAPALSRAK